MKLGIGLGIDSIRRDGGIPTVPQFNVILVDPDGVDLQTAHITWTASSKYETEIYRSLDAGEFAILTRLPISTGEYDDELMDGNSHTVEYYARFLDGIRELNTPLNLTVEAIAGGERITWDDNNLSSDADYIEIYRDGLKIASVLIGVETYDYTTTILGLPYKLRSSGGAYPINDDFSSYTSEVTLTEATPPAVISDGNTVGWYKYHVTADITKDGSNLVSLWKDNLGSGNDLATSGATRPTYQSTGILFASSTLTKTFTLVQPQYIYIVVKHITWTLNASIYDGGTQASAMIRSAATTPGLKAYAGSYSNQNDNLVIGQWGIIRVLYNGANSLFKINATTDVTGNFGAGNMGGLTLGSLAGGVVPANCEIKEVILRKTADNSTVSDSIYNYLKAKYSL